MKILSISIFCCLFAAYTTAQTRQDQACQYEQFMSEGEAAFADGDFQLATRKFKAAAVCCKRNRMTDCRANDRIIQSQEAYVNALQAEKEKLELASKAYRYAEENPTHAFRIAEYALAKDPTNEAAREQYLNLLQAHPFPFYGAVMQHQDYVSACAVAPVHHLIATGGWDNQVQLWDQYGQLQRRLGDEQTGHLEPVLALAFSSDGNSLLSAGMDNQIILWDLQGRIQARMIGHEGDVTAVTFSADGSRIISGSWDGTIRLWERSGRLIQTIRAHDDWITDLAYCPATGLIATAGWEGNVKLWNPKGELQTTLMGHRGVVSSVDFSQNGEELLTASWDGNVLLWDVQAQSVVQQYQGHIGLVYRAIFSPDDRHILTSGQDNTVRLWNMSGNQVQYFKHHNAPVGALAFAPDDEFFVTGGQDGKAVSWYYHGYQDHIYRFDEFRSISDLSYNSENGKMMVAAGTKAYLVDQSGRIERVMEEHVYDIVSTYTSADGQYMLTGALDVCLRDAAGDTIVIYRKHRHAICDLAVASGKQLVASGGRDDLVCLWDFNGENIFALKLESGHDVVYVGFSPAEDAVVAATATGKVFIIDLSGEVISEFKGLDVRPSAVAVSPNGQKLALGSVDGITTVYSLEGERLQRIVGVQDRITSLAFSPDGRYLLVGNSQGVATLRNEQGRAIQQLVGHRAAIVRVLFIDEDNMLTAGADGTVRKWRSIHSLMEDQKIYALSVAEQMAYGFEVSDSNARQADSPADANPDDNPAAKIGRQILDTEKVYFESGKSTYRLYASFYYSKKAHQSSHPAEKITLQRKAIDYHNDYSTEGNTFQKVILHSKQALWYLASKDTSAARTQMQKALSYKLSDDKRFKTIIAVRDMRLAILRIYQDDWPAAEQLILDNFHVKYHEGSDFYPQLSYLTSNEYLPEEGTSQYLLLQDLEFLESVGAGHPDFAKVRKLLQP